MNLPAMVFGKITPRKLDNKKGVQNLGNLSPRWEKQYMEKTSPPQKTLFDTFTQDLLSVTINLLLEFPWYVFDIGPAFMWSWGGEVLRIDGYLTLTLLIDENLAVAHRLMKYVDRFPWLEIIYVLSSAATNVLQGWKPFWWSTSWCRINTWRGRSNPENQGTIQGGERRHGSLVGLVLCDAIGSSRFSQRTERSGDLRIWTGTNLCLSWPVECTDSR